MSDVIVTVPKRLWTEWQEEGDLPGDAQTGVEYAYWLWGSPPDIQPGDRVYVCAYGKLRGYAPLTRIITGYRRGEFALCRTGGAVACTIDEPIVGFRGWRYRHWNREDERPFPRLANRRNAAGGCHEDRPTGAVAAQRAGIMSDTPAVWHLGRDDAHHLFVSATEHGPAIVEQDLASGAIQFVHIRTEQAARNLITYLQATFLTYDDDELMEPHGRDREIADELAADERWDRDGGAG